MYDALGRLRIIPLGRAILHEAHDPDRLSSLRERVAAESVQRNPVIAAPYGDDFLLLDGAHRAHAVSALGCEFVLAQVIDPPKTSESWTHLLSNPVLDSLFENRDFTVSGDSHDSGWLAAVETTAGTHYLRAREASLSTEVQALWSLQEAYPPGEPVRRLDSRAEPPISDGEARFRYRTFSVDELVEIVKGGDVLPAGITRFRVPERILGVRFPLSSLADGELSARQNELEELVSRQWKANRVRRYDEPVVLFE